MKRKQLLLLCCLASISVVFSNANASDLEADFFDPGNEARPRAYWCWLNGDVTKEGLTRDLEEAKAKGMGGLEMWDVEAMHNPTTPGDFVPAGPPFLGPESVEFIQHTIREAERLDLALGMITSSGWNAGGPWVPPVYASKNLFVSEVVVEGPDAVERKLPFPEVPPKCPKGENGLPQWYLEVALLAWPENEDEHIESIDKILNISEYFENGVLNWTPPAGKWRVGRYVCTNNGQQLIVASPNSKGPFIDFLDPEATEFHFNHIFERLGLEKGGDPSPLEYLEVDSMELYEGIQWSAKFAGWFNEQHGYDPHLWLPTLHEWTIGSRFVSDQFLYDYRKTVSDLLIYSHYTTGRELCNAYGLELVAEAGGPGEPVWNSCPMDSLKALGQVDVPRGEFWIKMRHNIFLVKEIASAANIYGKKFVDAEGWTTWRRWKDGPADLKRWLDRAFCEGLNRLTYHVFAHSPEGAGFPGRNYHAGADLNPQVTWWSKARPFMDYISRCSRMLQEGHFVADVLYYYGDEAPNFWPKIHNVPEKILLPGLGEGYDYDLVNTDVILNRLSVEDGRIVLPDGMSYRVLVLPEQLENRSDHKTMPLEVMQKLEELVAAGATVIGPVPFRVPGLFEHEARSAELRAIGARLWGENDGITATSNRYGKGQVVTSMNSRQWLQSQGIGPDFEVNDPGVLDYIHRRNETHDIYFVRNLADRPFAGSVAFRVTGRQAELWDPMTGEIAPVWTSRVDASVTELELEITAGGSTFVVFSDQPKFNRARLVEGEVSDFQLLGAESDNLKVRAWSNGRAAVMLADGLTGPLEVEGLPKPVAVEGPWQVGFDTDSGGPEQVSFPKLICWTAHEDDGVRNYSGTGHYRKNFTVPSSWLKDGRSIHLDLGDVREVAEIYVNGESAGIVWTSPFRADVSHLLKEGENELHVEVMNLWINRLVADGELPPEDRFTKSNIRAGQEWHAEPSGLLGPVQFLFAEDIEI